MLEKRRQLVGEVRVLVQEVLNVACRLGRLVGVVVEQRVQLLDDERVEMILVADRHWREDDGPLDHLHVHLPLSLSSEASFYLPKEETAALLSVVT